MPEVPDVELFVAQLPALLAASPGALPALPDLARWLARASAVRTDAASEEQALCERFGVTRQADWPVAPLALQGDGHDPADAYWLRADPAWLQATRGDLVLGRVGDLGLTRTDADALCAALDSHFAADGLRFLAPAPQRWYLRLPRPAGLATTPAREVLGRSVDTLLPRGADALAWHRRLNEMQMLLHDHPVNAAREARGEPPVNSVWLWGGGVLPRCAPRREVAVWSDAALARGLALCAGARWASLPSDATALLGTPAESRIVVMDADPPRGPPLEPLRALHDRWISPLLAAVRSGRVRSAALVLQQDGALWRLHLSRADLWKLWSRPPDWLTVPQRPAGA
jgi:hypothetical protein